MFGRAVEDEGVKGGRRNPQSSASYMEITRDDVVITPPSRDRTPTTTVDSGSQLSTIPVYSAWSDENTLEFTDSDSYVSSDTTAPAGTLRKFNTHMNLEAVHVHRSPESTDSAGKWRNRMSDLELTFEGENLDYVRYETPDQVTPVIMTSSEPNVTSQNRQDASPRNEIDDYMDGLMSLFDDTDTPVFSFFPLAVTLDMEPLNFESESSEGVIESTPGEYNSL